MRSIIKIFAANLLCFAIIVSCDMFGPQISDEPASGQIAGQSFTFVSGYAGPSGTDASYWLVYLFPQAPAAGADSWDAAAYTDPFPYINFTFLTSLVPGEFIIDTYAGFGDTEYIGINGWLSSLDSILFDSGTLIIEEFDLVNGTVSGKIIANTLDESSYLDGTFEVSIDPAHL